ncbi:16S rRNA (guanine(966)-N(2))-methyltransferase RsmD [Candidatus Pelagibacter sp.]|nr:16S rRNA (guanine(966)-N(2))-methyltransferase RsmD [Candidatus Pelagibacter sp.]
MRIIGGNFKGKKLLLPEDKLTRPLKDMVKESIFNIIEHSKKINIKVKNSLILDLFSGSGSFGIECLSRSARKVVFFESHNKALKILRENVDSLKGKLNYEIYNEDCFDFSANNLNLNLKFDIIFIDPPFKEIRINNILEIIIAKKILNNKGVIIVHRHKKDIIELTKKFKILEKRNYGISTIFFGN